jgi:hypothetical protein
MTLSERLNAWIGLGERIKNLSEEELEEMLWQANARNNWFTPDNVRFALKGLLHYLRPEALTAWAARYPIDSSSDKRVGLVMAGNIPMVGLHDLICVTLAGHRVLGKLSSQDPWLLRKISELLVAIEPRFADRIVFTDEPLRGIEAIIATGSDNSARYFEYYFAKYPHIIRKNRTSCAILNGQETPEQIARLAPDITLYYGLGCRNVSKLYLPKDYDISHFYAPLDALTEHLRLNHKYNNNYDYNKSIYLVNSIPHFDNGHLILTQSPQPVSPISVLHYEHYENEADLHAKINLFADKWQCILSADRWYEGSIGFGEAQLPAIDDYADGIDTMAFLAEL